MANRLRQICLVPKCDENFYKNITFRKSTTERDASSSEIKLKIDSEKNNTSEIKNERNLSLTTEKNNTSEIKNERNLSLTTEKNNTSERKNERNLTLTIKSRPKLGIFLQKGQTDFAPNGTQNSHDSTKVSTENFDTDKLNNQQPDKDNEKVDATLSYSQDKTQSHHSISDNICIEASDQNEAKFEIDCCLENNEELFNSSNTNHENILSASAYNYTLVSDQNQKRASTNNSSKLKNNLSGDSYIKTEKSPTLQINQNKRRSSITSTGTKDDLLRCKSSTKENKLSTEIDLIPQKEADLNYASKQNMSSLDQKLIMSDNKINLSPPEDKSLSKNNTKENLLTPSKIKNMENLTPSSSKECCTVNKEQLDSSNKENVSPFEEKRSSKGSNKSHSLKINPESWTPFEMDKGIEKHDCSKNWVEEPAPAKSKKKHRRVSNESQKHKNNSLSGNDQDKPGPHTSLTETTGDLPDCCRPPTKENTLSTENDLNPHQEQRSSKSSNKSHSLKINLESWTPFEIDKGIKKHDFIKNLEEEPAPVKSKKKHRRVSNESQKHKNNSLSGNDQDKPGPHTSLKETKGDLSDCCRPPTKENTLSTENDLNPHQEKRSSKSSNKSHSLKINLESWTPFEMDKGIKKHDCIKNLEEEPAPVKSKKKHRRVSYESQKHKNNSLSGNDQDKPGPQTSLTETKGDLSDCCRPPTKENTLSTENDLNPHQGKRSSKSSNKSHSLKINQNNWTPFEMDKGIKKHDCSKNWEEEPAPAKSKKEHKRMSIESEEHRKNTFSASSQDELNNTSIETEDDSIKTEDKSNTNPTETKDDLLSDFMSSTKRNKSSTENDLNPEKSKEASNINIDDFPAEIYSSHTSEPNTSSSKAANKITSEMDRKVKKHDCCKHLEEPEPPKNEHRRSSMGSESSTKRNKSSTENDLKPEKSKEASNINIDDFPAEIYSSHTIEPNTSSSKAAIKIASEMDRKIKKHDCCKHLEEPEPPKNEHRRSSMESQSSTKRNKSSTKNDLKPEKSKEASNIIIDDFPAEIYSSHTIEPNTSSSKAAIKIASEMDRKIKKHDCCKDLEEPEPPKNEHRRSSMGPQSSTKRNKSSTENDLKPEKSKEAKSSTKRNKSSTENDLKPEKSKEAKSSTKRNKSSTENDLKPEKSKEASNIIIDDFPAEIYSSHTIEPNTSSSKAAIKIASEMDRKIKKHDCCKDLEEPEPPKNEHRRSSMGPQSSTKRNKSSTENDLKPEKSKEAKSSTKRNKSSTENDLKPEKSKEASNINIDDFPAEIYSSHTIEPNTNSSKAAIKIASEMDRKIKKHDCCKDLEEPEPPKNERRRSSMGSQSSTKRNKSLTENDLKPEKSKEASNTNIDDFPAKIYSRHTGEPNTSSSKAKNDLKSQKCKKAINKSFGDASHEIYSKHKSSKKEILSKDCCSVDKQLSSKNNPSEEKNFSKNNNKGNLSTQNMENKQYFEIDKNKKHASSELLKEINCNKESLKHENVPIEPNKHKDDNKSVTNISKPPAPTVLDSCSAELNRSSEDLCCEKCQDSPNAQGDLNNFPKRWYCCNQPKCPINDPTSSTYKFLVKTSLCCNTKECKMASKLCDAYEPMVNIELKISGTEDFGDQKYHYLGVDAETDYEHEEVPMEKQKSIPIVEPSNEDIDKQNPEEPPEKDRRASTSDERRASTVSWGVPTVSRITIEPINESEFEAEPEPEIEVEPERALKLSISSSTEEVIARATAEANKFRETPQLTRHQPSVFGELVKSHPEIEKESSAVGLSDGYFYKSQIDGLSLSDSKHSTMCCSSLRKKFSKKKRKKPPTQWDQISSGRNSMDDGRRRLNFGHPVEEKKQQINNMLNNM